MNISILSVTEQGKLISDKLYDLLIDDSTILSVNQYHKNVIKTVDEIFNNTDCIIGIMASGIMIRSIASHVDSKLSDPAILLIDDNANFVISLLSGHFGGANDLTLKIASLLNAQPVITTSTDVNNKIGIDSIAKRFYCNLENPKNIKYINKALVNSIKVDLHLPKSLDYILTDETYDSYNITFDDTLDVIIAKYDNHEVILHPKQMVMGIGARRDIASDKVKYAITQACNILKIPPSRINFFATADVKANEKGILINAEYYNKQIKIINMDDIKNFQDESCSESDFVMKQFGVKGVCEPSALIANGTNSRLIFKKTAYNGVTIAVSIKD
ncbi:MAG: cobalamin biosynthesis protein CbiG [Methanosphaera stadtmanae]|jgi:cobalt-precorrin 5A hydrolase|nr:cobalamin biosynthesis protein CbiG [Methanosphaera stadtmanae]